MSKVKPVLFNTEMVRAILCGEKTVTRRVIKFPDGQTGRLPKCGAKDYIFYPSGIKYAPYNSGQNLYVRETWRVGAWDIKNQKIAFDYKDGICGDLVHINDRELFERLVNQSREDARKAKREYNGDDFVWEKGKSPCRWRPSIHMPKEVARIWLKVTDVRVERLQDMKINDFLSEGVEVRPEAFNDPGNAYGQAREIFKDIWNSTIKESELGSYGWDANPWVWVIEFERCEKLEKEITDAGNAKI